MIDFIKDKKVVIAVGVLVLFFILLVVAGASKRQGEQASLEEEEYLDQLMAEANSGVNESDSLLMQMQPDLEKTYGKVPDGFIWEVDGTVLSLGDKSMSAEDVVYAYFKGLSSLDMSTVERYSRDSVVVSSYSSYFSEDNKNTDYTDQFLRNIYRCCLLSLQIEGIENVSVFAENKQVFSVKASMLDLTDKEFWLDDADTVYKNLYLYESSQSDSAKGDMYLYEYILDYYKSESPSRRDVTFDITVQRYADLDSGWLVSIDSDVNDACVYKDGKLVVSYIKEMYINEGRQIVLDSMTSEE